MRPPKKHAGLISIILIVVIMAMHLLPIQSHAQGLETAFSITGGSVRLKYEYTYTLGISDLGGSPIELTVIQDYIVVISEYNSTHVRVDSGPVGNITVAFVSGSWISIGSFISWASSNITNFIQGFTVPSIDSSYIPKNKLADVLSAVMGTAPIKEIPASGTCFVISVDGVLFEAKKYDVGLAGEAYYDCKTGILLKYRDITSTPVNIGDKTVQVTKTINMKLEAANNELLQYMIVGTEETPSQQYSGFPVEWILLIASGVILVASVIVFIRAYRSSRHHK